MSDTEVKPAIPPQGLPGPGLTRDVTIRFPEFGYAVIAAFAGERKLTVEEFVNEGLTFWCAYHSERKLGFSDLLCANPQTKKMKIIGLDHDTAKERTK